MSAGETESESENEHIDDVTESVAETPYIPTAEDEFGAVSFEFSGLF